MYLIQLGLVSLFLLGVSATSVVTNESIPAGKAKTIRFTEDIRFGGSENDESTSIWPAATTSLSVDARGHIYIADTGDMRVLEFDPKGQFVRTVIKKGEGPDEFQNLFRFTLLNSGGAVGFELLGLTARLKHFDTNLKYIKSKISGQGVNPALITFSPDGTKFGGTCFTIRNNKLYILSAVLSMDFSKLLELTSAERPIPNPAGFSDPKYVAEFLSGNLKAVFKETGHINFDDLGSVYTAVNNRYEITVWDPSMKEKRLIVSRKHKPLPNPPEEGRAIIQAITEQFAGIPQAAEIFNDQVIAKALKIADLPLVKPPVFGIIPMERGSFLVIHNVSMVTGIQTADIFSAEGLFQGQVTLPNRAFMFPRSGLLFPKMIFKGGYAYTVETSDDGVNEAVRYKYALVDL